MLAISVLLDTWVSTVAEVTKLSQIAGRFVPPSKIGSSSDTVVVQLTSKDGNVVFCWPYVKIGKEVLFSGEPEENSSIKAMVPGLWPTGF